MDIDLLNFSEIARRLNVTPAYVSQLMTGERTYEKRLIQIASMLRISIEDLKLQISRHRVHIQSKKVSKNSTKAHQKHELSSVHRCSRNLARVAV
jgi:DNA-binding transcriptional regulator YdaS (Cro superfamily)